MRAEHARTTAQALYLNIEWAKRYIAWKERRKTVMRRIQKQKQEDRIHNVILTKLELANANLYQSISQRNF